MGVTTTIKPTTTIMQTKAPINVSEIKKPFLLQEYGSFSRFALGTESRLYIFRFPCLLCSLKTAKFINGPNSKFLKLTDIFSAVCKTYIN